MCVFCYASTIHRVQIHIRSECRDREEYTIGKITDYTIILVSK